ncbi:MAG: division/cell wall cluster transcriptional repressor MraZ [Chloroflexi bacterium]|nr:division/cell wall cluster transcriptional repressor MraZ [Chloroflexota bacterium]
MLVSLGERVSFLGTFEGKIDPQGRIIVPRAFRDEVQDGLVMAMGFEGCITVYTNEAWANVIAEVKRLSIFDRTARDVRRHMLAGAFTGKVDAQGRTVVPPPLREHAGIADDIVMAGSDDYFEIWSAKGWQDRKAKMGDPADLAERLVTRP